MNVERLPTDEIADADWRWLAGDSLFASRAFLELWRHVGGRPVAWIVADAGRPAAMLPGVEFGSGPLARFASLPDGCYGGLRVDPDRNDERVRLGRLLLEAIARRDYAWAHVFDFRASLGAHPGFALEMCVTLVADLSRSGGVAPDAKLRSQIRRAWREGVRPQPFAWDRHSPGLLDLVERTARRHHQRPRYPVALYRALARLAEQDERVRWIHCERDGNPVASHIYFREGDTLQAWQSYSDRCWTHLKANQAIRGGVCREAAARGVRWLNLGATPEGAAGLAYYKARWGGRPVRFASWTRRNAIGALARREPRREREPAALPPVAVRPLAPA